MKYYSTELDKLFDDEKDLVKAEKDAAAAKEKAIADAKAKKEARAERAKEVEQAIKDADEANMKAEKLIEAFIKDYGSFHATFDNDFYFPFKSLFNKFFI